MSAEGMLRPLRMKDAAALRDQQQVMEIAVCVRTNRPIMSPAAFRNGLHVQEAFVDVCDRLSVQRVLRNFALHHFQESRDRRCAS